MPLPALVVKVGGSLYDMPDLATRLQRWLERYGAAVAVLIPGGGATVDALRALDRCQALGEENAHWLALRTLTVNAHFLAALWPGAHVTAALDDCTPLADGPAILDAFTFACWDEATHPGQCLPHLWEATSDSLAARVAVVAEAARLCLLKSTPAPDGVDWTDAKHGFVDPLFREVLSRSSRRLRVEAINLRSWFD